MSEKNNNNSKKTMSAAEVEQACERVYEQCCKINPKLKSEVIAGWRLDAAIDRWKEEERLEEMYDQLW